MATIPGRPNCEIPSGCHCSPVFLIKKLDVSYECVYGSNIIRPDTIPDAHYRSLSSHAHIPIPATVKYKAPMMIVRCESPSSLTLSS